MAERAVVERSRRYFVTNRRSVQLMPIYIKIRNYLITGSHPDENRGRTC